MLAVLTDALPCLQNYYFRLYNYGKTVFEEVESWIMDDDAIWPFSFRSICDHLGIHPDYLRCMLFRWRDNQLASRAVARINPLRGGRPVSWIALSVSWSISKTATPYTLAVAQISLWKFRFGGPSLSQTRRLSIIPVAWTLLLLLIDSPAFNG